MKIGILSDAHGNWKALRKCLQALQKIGVDEIYFLGDAVGYLPGEKEVIDLLHSFQVSCQKGNHEAILLGELFLSQEKDRVYGLSQARQRILPEYLHLLKQWPERRTISCGGREILMVHGSPSDNLQGYVYPKADFSSFADYPFDAIFMGHTHYPFAHYDQESLIVNVGSCGLPRDQGDMAAFVVYDCGEHKAEIYRVRFDWLEVVKDFRQGSFAPEVSDSFARTTKKWQGIVIEQIGSHGEN